MHDQYLWGWLRFSGLFSGPLRWGVATESSVSTHRGSGAWGVEMLRNEWAFPKTFANNCFGTLCTRGISRANIFIDTYILALSLAHDAKIAEKKSKELWSYLWYNRLRRKVCSIAWQLDAHSHHPQVSSISAFFLGLPQKKHVHSEHVCLSKLTTVRWGSSGDWWRGHEVAMQIAWWSDRWNLVPVEKRHLLRA